MALVFVVPCEINFWIKKKIERLVFQQNILMKEERSRENEGWNVDSVFLKSFLFSIKRCQVSFMCFLLHLRCFSFYLCLKLGDCNSTISKKLKTTIMSFLFITVWYNTGLLPKQCRLRKIKTVSQCQSFDKLKIENWWSYRRVEG